MLGKVKSKNTFQNYSFVFIFSSFLYNARMNEKFAVLERCDGYIVNCNICWVTEYLITNVLHADVSRLAYVELYKSWLGRESSLIHCHFGQKHHKEICFPEPLVLLLFTW